MLKQLPRTFLRIFVPTCAVAVGGLWLAITRSGFWRGVGWVTVVVSGLAALMQIIGLIDVLARTVRLQHDAEQNLGRLMKRDAELFAQGKSFDEVRAQYKRPKP
jgi:hypothetical protein